MHEWECGWWFMFVLALSYIWLTLFYPDWLAHVSFLYIWHLNSRPSDLRVAARFGSSFFMTVLDKQNRWIRLLTFFFLLPLLSFPVRDKRKSNHINHVSQLNTLLFHSARSRTRTFNLLLSCSFFLRSLLVSSLKSTAPARRYSSTTVRSASPTWKAQ